MFENNEGWGAIFKAKEKKTDKSPDYTGTAKFNGEDISLSLWVKKSKDGHSYFSVGVKKQIPKTDNKPSKKDDDDDLPF